MFLVMLDDVERPVIVTSCYVTPHVIAARTGHFLASHISILKLMSEKNKIKSRLLSCYTGKKKKKQSTVSLERQLLYRLFL